MFIYKYFLAVLKFFFYFFMKIFELQWCLLAFIFLNSSPYITHIVIVLSLHTVIGYNSSVW